MEYKPAQEFFNLPNSREPIGLRPVLISTFDSFPKKETNKNFSFLGSPLDLNYVAFILEYSVAFLRPVFVQILLEFYNSVYSLLNFGRKPYPEIHFEFRRSSFVNSVNSAKQILGLFKYVHIVHMCRHRAQSRWCYLRLSWVYFLLFYRRKNYSAEMIPELHGN